VVNNQALRDSGKVVKQQDKLALKMIGIWRIWNGKLEKNSVLINLSLDRLGENSNTTKKAVRVLKMIRG
jgi:hypothetical protein